MPDSNTFRDYEMHTILKDRLGIIKPWTSIEGIHLICLCLRTLHISILALFCNIMIFSMSSYGYYDLDYHHRHWRDGVGHMKIVYTTHHMYDWYLNRCTQEHVLTSITVYIKNLNMKQIKNQQWNVHQICRLAQIMQIIVF